MVTPKFSRPYALTLQLYSSVQIYWLSGINIIHIIQKAILRWPPEYLCTYKGCHSFDKQVLDTLLDLGPDLLAQTNGFTWTYLLIESHLARCNQVTRLILPGYVDEAGNPVDINNLPPAETQRPEPEPGPGPGPQTPAPPPKIQCIKSQTVVNGLGEVCKGTLIFNEEFEKKTLKEITNWQSEIKFPEGPVSSDIIGWGAKRLKQLSYEEL